MLWGPGRGALSWLGTLLPVPHRPALAGTPGLTNVLEVQVVVEELVLLEVGVLGGINVVLDIVLDLADGVHQDGVVI